GTDRARQALADGHGLKRLHLLIEAQGGDPQVLEDPTLLPSAPCRHEVRANGRGWLAAVDAASIGRAAAHVGAGRQTMADRMNPGAGIGFEPHIGDWVANGDLLATVFATTDSKANTAEDMLRTALQWSDTPVNTPSLVHDI